MSEHNRLSGFFTRPDLRNRARIENTAFLEGHNFCLHPANAARFACGRDR